MTTSGPVPPDEFQLWMRGELARIDQLHADADRKRQELAPGLMRTESWKAFAVVLTAGAALFAAGVAFAKIMGI